MAEVGSVIVRNVRRTAGLYYVGSRSDAPRLVRAEPVLATLSGSTGRGRMAARPARAISEPDHDDPNHDDPNHDDPNDPNHHDHHDHHTPTWATAIGATR